MVGFLKFLDTVIKSLVVRLFNFLLRRKGAEAAEKVESIKILPAALSLKLGCPVGRGIHPQIFNKAYGVVSIRN